MAGEQIIFSDTALADIEFIEKYISNDSPAMARNYVLQIFDAIEQIGQFPKSGRVVPEFMIDSLREIIFGK
jgi:toxin ParE1/3/4